MATNESDSLSTMISVDHLKQKPVMGSLGYPLGKIVAVGGLISQEALGAKAAKKDPILSIELVNDRPLAQPIRLPFSIFMTAQVAQPEMGKKFFYIGYETGGFRGVPHEAFRFVTAVASTEHSFDTYFIVLSDQPVPGL